MKIRLICIGVLVLFLPGCFSKTLVNSAVTPGETKEYSFSHSAGFGEPVVTPECENGIAEISQGYTFVQQLVGSLTIGFYQPGTARVTCAE